MKDFLRGLLVEVPTVDAFGGRTGSTDSLVSALVELFEVASNGADINGNDGFHLSLIFNGL